MFLFAMLFVLVFTSAVGAVPIDRDEFSSLANNFDFSSTPGSDFTIQGGYFDSGEYKTWGTIKIDFILPMSAVGLDVTRTKNQSIAMSLYDSNDISLETYTWSGSVPFFIGLNNGVSNVAYVKIFSNGDDLDIDNLIYQTDIHSSPVPEPATLLLLGSGLMGLVGFRRNRKKG